MPAISLLTHKCTGHGGYPPRPIISGTITWFTVDSLEVATVNSVLDTHCAGDCHSGKVAKGADWFTIDGKSVARIGDDVDCGSAMADGQPWFVID